MSEKTYLLVSTLVGVACTAGSAILTYVNPPLAPVVVACIGSFNECFNVCLARFVK